MATKRSIVHNARARGSRRRRALGVYKRDNARPHARHLGLCGRRGGEIMRPRAQTGESLISVPVTSQWCAQDGAGQPARTAWPPRRHPSRGWGRHTGALHAACGRSHVPGVMTTTLLRVNAQELQVSTAVEENARNAPACGSRAESAKPTIAAIGIWIVSDS